ncbi:hypothetical protein B0H34DRAFT_434178 [Crassisporium funariophilum]|nr:hypothetical protein B0H34DRAFT_434178 [Crassisporium funariophilum]
MLRHPSQLVHCHMSLPSTALACKGIKRHYSRASLYHTKQLAAVPSISSRTEGIYFLFINRPPLGPSIDIRHLPLWHAHLHVTNLRNKFILEADTSMTSLAPMSSTRNRIQVSLSQAAKRRRDVRIGRRRSTQAPRGPLTTELLRYLGKPMHALR